MHTRFTKSYTCNQSKPCAARSITTLDVKLTRELIQQAAQKELGPSDQKKATYPISENDPRSLSGRHVYRLQIVTLLAC
jgi:hypothetical protein